MDAQMVQVAFGGKSYQVYGPRGDHVMGVLARGGFYEEPLLAAVRAMGLRGTYVDAGAHVGNHSLFFATCCAARRVVAIEPQGAVFPFLVRNVALQAEVPVEFHSCALAEAPGRGIMRQHSATNCGMATLEAGDEVNVLTLDALLGAADDVCFIKVDVEGAEARVLRGALGVIERCHPVLAVEAATSQAQQAVRELLAPLGYLERGPFGATPTWLWSVREGDLPREAVLATLWERRAVARAAAASIAPQVDIMHVVLNRVGGEDMAAWRACFPQSNVRFHERDNRLGDAERYGPVTQRAIYYFSIDDDLLYPDGYVAHLVAGVQRFEQPVCLHGKYYPMAPGLVRSYIAQPGMRRYQCRERLSEDVRVHVPGTGVMCWRGDQLDLRYERFAARNRADLEVARFAAEAGARIMCLAHEPLEYLAPPGETIWDQETSKDGPELVAAVNAVLAATRITVGVSMIVKDEEACLATALESVRGVDEIVVVDTGSTDRTVEIAREHGARVFAGDEFRWRDDFAFSRNQSLDRCTADWVLILDADEILEPGGLAKVRAACAAARNATAIGVNCKSGSRYMAAVWEQHRALGIVGCSEKLPEPIPYQEWEMPEVHVTPRLFRRWAGIRWNARIHNHLSVRDYVPSDISIVFGRSPAHAKDPDRALRILTEVVESTPGAVREVYYLAREYFYRQDYATALRWYETYLERGYYGAEMADAWLAKARCLQHLKRYSDARDACLQAIKLNANFKEACLFMAELSGPGNRKRWNQIAETASNEGILFVRVPASTGAVELSK